MKFINMYYQVLEKVKDLPLLFFRLLLAYGFYEPAKNKWSDIQSIVDWFTEMQLPLPKLNAYLAASTEAAGVVLLLLGLGTRFITIPLIITMFVAIQSVHTWEHFSAGDNGFEIPLYYIAMLFSLLVYGSGRASLDHLIGVWLEKKNKSLK
jgi:putative oxidoreductase